jgi:hypothetical protein
MIKIFTLHNNDTTLRHNGVESTHRKMFALQPSPNSHTTPTYMCVGPTCMGPTHM